MQSNQDILVAGGSITPSGSSSDNVLQFTFSNATWSTVGDGANLPGPVTAITVNNGNYSSIFAAGRCVCILSYLYSGNLYRHSSVDGSSSFLAAWNGHTWISQGSTFGGTSTVSQLAMVPLQNQHSAQGIIEGDRMLLMSGSLVSSFGQASSVLFDGKDFIPYVVSASADGSAGSVAGLFNSLANFSFSRRSKSYQCSLDLDVNDTLLNRFPCHWRRHPNIPRHRRWHSFPDCSPWRPLDPLLSSRRGHQQVRSC